MSTVRVVSWNLDHNPVDVFDRVLVSIETLKSVNADILLLQECSEDIAEIVGKSLGLRVHFVNEHGEAVLSRYQAVSSGGRVMGSERSAGFAYAHLNTGCHAIMAISTHFTWGGGREFLRLENAREVDLFATEYFNGVSDLDFITVLGGDLNTEPNSDTVRYLRGEAVVDGKSTLWSDTWMVGEGDGFTSARSNPYATRTARNVGLTPGSALLLPNRRIDYLFVKGYAYCRAGAPIKSVIIGVEPSSSDHYGISVDLSC